MKMSKKLKKLEPRTELTDDADGVRLNLSLAFFKKKEDGDDTVVGWVMHHI